MKIDIVGPYPPPYGGVSVHIARMLPVLRENGFEPKVYNQYSYESVDEDIVATKRSVFWWFFYFFYKKASIVHFHQFSEFHFPYVFLFSWFSKSKTFITIHNEKLMSYSPLKRIVYLSFLKASRNISVISVSLSVKEMLLAGGVKDVHYLPAYVPPNNISNKYFEPSGSKKIVFNAWRIDSFDDVKRYGVDFLVELAKKKSDVDFYFFVGDISSGFIKEYFNSCNVDNLRLIFGESLVDYLEDADIFLRLNREDAYGVSIQEALDLGVPAIASDICKRPKGCILYDFNSFDDLENKFNYALSKSSGELIKGRVITTYHKELVNLYKNRTGL